MGLDDRDYTNGEHYPSCTCMACYRKRVERAAENWCSRHNRPKGHSGCPVCLTENSGRGAPDNGKAKPVQNEVVAKVTAEKDPASADNGGQSGHGWGRTLKGILGKRGSA